MAVEFHSEAGLPSYSAGRPGTLPSHCRRYPSPRGAWDWSHGSNLNPATLLCLVPRI
jgi:hypothetical protein